MLMSSSVGGMKQERMNEARRRFELSKHCVPESASKVKPEHEGLACPPRLGSVISFILFGRAWIAPPSSERSSSSAWS